MKKLILAVFIVFSLSFSPQSGNLFAREKQTIVYILDFKDDVLMNNFIKRNERKKLQILVSLTLQCILCIESIPYNNTS